MFETALEYIKYHAENTPDRIAIIEGETGNTITFANFWRKIRNGASYLKQKYVQPGDRVVILAFSSCEFFITFYAVQLIGGVAIPIEKNSSAERVAEILQYFNTTHFIAQNSGIIEVSDTSEKFDFPDKNTVGLIMFTTGTTGQNKGVILSLKNGFANADNYVQAINLQSSDVISISVPMSHSGGLRHCVAANIAGCTALLINSVIFIKSVIETFKKYNVSVIRLVPAQLSILINTGGDLLAELSHQVRCVTIGSALTPETEKEKLSQILPDSRLFVTYGCTEAAGFSHFEFSKYSPKQFCVGKAAVHSQFHIVDEQGNEIQSSLQEPGIIALSGDNVMQGYYNEPELTKSVLKNGMVITADLGFKDDKGLYYVIGRRDDVIVSGGNKISPGEVENAVLSIDGIAEVACIGVSDGILGNVPKLFVVMKSDVNFNAENIRLVLFDKLEKYKVPNARDIVLIDKLPRSDGTGKVLYKELKKL